MLIDKLKRMLFGQKSERLERQTQPAGRVNREVIDATTDEEVAHQKTQDDLADQRYFLLSAEKYEEFLNLLEQPAQPNLGLARLFSKTAPWERQGDD